MAKHYVTFGHEHIHKIEDKILYCDVVARFEADSYEEGRKKAFELFGPKFSFDYHGDQWNEEDMKYYKGGYVDLD